MMERKNRSFLILIFSAIFFLTAIAEVEAGVTITVPDDYPTIQQAVNAAFPYDTVYIRPGTYHEHLTIGKPLTLKGEDRETTVIDGDGFGNVIYISSSYVTLNGLKISNGIIGIDLRQFSYIHHLTIRDLIIDSNRDFGISGSYVGGYHVIENCIFSHNGYGFKVHHISNSIIRNCEVYQNVNGLGPGWSSNIQVIGNRIHHNTSRGLYINSCSNSLVEKNEVYSNRTGIDLAHVASNITVKDNIILDNYIGLDLDEKARGHKIYHNDVIDNFQQVIYLKLNSPPVSWDDGYPSGGNYWSDYDGVDLDNDGIGDTPYRVTEFAKDNYPLMNPLWHSIKATIDINPDTLNLKSKGKWITAYIELPDDFDIANIDISTVLLNNTVQAEKKPVKIDDNNGNGILDLMIKFNRNAVQELLEGESGYVELTLTGKVESTPFEGSYTIKVIN
jgi:parallel beta-helix repeat protein